MSACRAPLQLPAHPSIQVSLSFSNLDGGTRVTFGSTHCGPCCAVLAFTHTHTPYLLHFFSFRVTTRDKPSGQYHQQNGELIAKEPEVQLGDPGVI